MELEFQGDKCGSREPSFVPLPTNTLLIEHLIRFYNSFTRVSMRDR